MSVRSGFAPADGTEIAYEVAGEGPAVLLVHGRALDRRMWGPQWDAFAARFTVVRCDLRGFGRSQPGDAPYSHADDLARLCDHLGLARVAMVGCSLGGGAALNFAVTWPERLWALVPVGSSLGGYAWSAEARETFRELNRIAAEQGPRAANAFFRRSAFFASTQQDPAVAARLRELMGGEAGSHGPRPELGRALVPPAIERLGGVTAPTLVVVGEHDAHDVHAIAGVIVERVPHARRATLDGLGHLPSLEAPERFNALVLEFLASVAR